MFIFRVLIKIFILLIKFLQITHENVNAIGPSLIRTPLAEKTLNDPERLAVYLANVPLKRVGEPKDLVGLCVFLAAPASDFITGQIIYLDGGLTAVG